MKTGKVKERLDFGGVPGNVVLMVFLPVVVYYLYFCLRFNNGGLIPAGVTAEAWRGFGISIIPTGRAFLFYGTWLAFQALLQLLVPGRKVLGRVLADGKRLPYRMNGLVSFIITLSCSGRWSSPASSTRWSFPRMSAPWSRWPSSACS